MKRLIVALWKSRWRWLGGSLLLLSCVFIFALYTFNFFWQATPQLAWLQQKLEINQPDKPGELARPSIIGHRGSGQFRSDKRPGYIGNTRTAIQHGIEANVSYIEIDIRRADNELVVFHDETLKRAVGVDVKLKDCTLAELKDYEVLTDGEDKSILTLQDVFEEFAALDVRFILDIKVDGIREQLNEIVKEYYSQDQVILFGEYKILEKFRQDDYALGYTALWKDNQFRFPFGYSYLITNCQKLNCRYLVLPTIFLKQDLIDKANEERIEVWTYGSEDVRDWKLSVRRGVSGLIVDDVKTAMMEFPAM